MNCGNCATRCETSKYCFSCATAVSDNCWDEEEACCVNCILTFGSTPKNRDQVTTPTFRWNASAPSFFIPNQPVPAETAWVKPFATQKVQQAPAVQNTKPPASPQQESAYQPMQMPVARNSEKTKSKDRKDSSFSCSFESTTCDEDSTDDSVCKYDSNEETVTKMICNIPCRLSHQDIVDAIEKEGFKDMYDFVYLPGHGRVNTTKQTNIGYAFVNFKNAKFADLFAEHFEDFQFQGTSSCKTCKIKPAHMQGFNAANANKSRANKS